jgi:hypothetical protein
VTVFAARLAQRGGGGNGMIRGLLVKHATTIWLTLVDTITPVLHAGEPFFWGTFPTFINRCDF